MGSCSKAKGRGTKQFNISEETVLSQPNKKRIFVVDARSGSENRAKHNLKRNVLGSGKGLAIAGGAESGVGPAVADQPWRLVPQEVPRSEWPTFFAGISRLHQGWPVSLHVLGTSSWIRNTWKTQRFAEIALATQNGGKQPISIVLTDPRKKFTRTIAAPARVWFVDKLGPDAVIAIEAGRQSAVMLRFYSPERTGVDGRKDSDSLRS